MYAEVIHPDTGEKLTLKLPNISTIDLDRMQKEYTTDQKINSYIEQLAVSAEIKALLSKLAEFTVTVGRTMIKMGKKILEMVFMLAAKYKHAAFGLLLGAMLASLIASIPLFGPPLAAFLQPLLMLFGLGKGLWEDLKKDSPEIAISIQEAGSVFTPLNGSAA